jgi:hypothetical protein
LAGYIGYLGVPKAAGKKPWYNPSAFSMRGKQVNSCSTNNWWEQTSMQCR